jgi:hypothetical protein
MAGFIVEASDVEKNQKEGMRWPAGRLIVDTQEAGRLMTPPIFYGYRVTSNMDTVLVTNNYNAEMRLQSPRRRKSTPSSSTIFSSILLKFLLDDLQPVCFSNSLI